MLCARYLLAQGHAAAQSAGEADDFGHKRFEREVLLKNDSSEDGLHLGNTGTCRGAQLNVIFKRHQTFSFFLHLTVSTCPVPLTPTCQSF